MYLIRHGDTPYTQKKIVAGATDVPLAPQGVAQMEAVARFLADKPLKAVVSSPLQRAARPARLLAGERGLRYQAESAFAEVNFGDWEGMKYAEVALKYPLQFAKALRVSPCFTFPNGENLDAFRCRVQDAFVNVAASMDGPTAIYAHGGTLRMILSRLLNITLREAQKTEISCGSITILEPTSDGSFSVATLNQYSHLPALR